jgi:Transglutaminase-like superfamily
MVFRWQDWHRYRTLPVPSRRLIRESLLALFMARLALACVPFRCLAGWLGTVGAESGGELSPAQEQAARDISWAVGALARRVPWDSRCLAQAIAAYRMLLKRGIEATVYFGVKPDPRRPFDAHAWLRCGPCLVTGGEGHSDYRVLAQFSRKVTQVA